MSPIVAYHATRSVCRESIRQRGLIGAQPRSTRPWGVYVFNDDLMHPVWSRTRLLAPVLWSATPTGDLWRVAYIGPLTIDQYVANGLILLESVEPHEISLVNTSDT